MGGFVLLGVIGANSCHRSYKCKGMHSKGQQADGVKYVCLQLFTIATLADVKAWLSEVLHPFPVRSPAIIRKQLALNGC
jgi:hypothetical protein